MRKPGRLYWWLRIDCTVHVPNVIPLFRFRLTEGQRKTLERALRR